MHRAIARRYGFPGNLAEWGRTRTAIKDEVLERGWSEESQAFRQHYDTGAALQQARAARAFGPPQKKDKRHALVFFPENSSK